MKSAYFDLKHQKMQKKNFGAQGDIFAYHAPGTMPILTKSVKKGQKWPIKWKIRGDKY